MHRHDDDLLTTAETVGITRMPTRTGLSNLTDDNNRVTTAAPMTTRTTAPGAETKDQTPASDDLLTTAEVAAITRTPASTLRYWRHIRTGPRSFRVGRRVVYRRSTVERWLVEQETVESPAAILPPPRPHASDRQDAAGARRWYRTSGGDRATDR